MNAEDQTQLPRTDGAGLTNRETAALIAMNGCCRFQTIWFLSNRDRKMTQEYMNSF